MTDKCIYVYSKHQKSQSGKQISFKSIVSQNLHLIAVHTLQTYL